MSPLRGESSSRSHARDASLRSTPSSWGGARILVIDRNLLTAEAIVFALTQMRFSVRFVTAVPNGHLGDLIAWKPELALLDIDSVDDTMCVEVISALRVKNVPVALLGGRGDEYLLGECVQAGANSVVDKSSSLDELVQTVMRLLAREVIMDDDVKRQLTEPYRRETRERRARLTPFDVLTNREKCVLAELMEGNGPDMIAQRASVSVSTVRTQIKAILQKLGVNSQLAAAAMARRAGWSFDVNTQGEGSEPSGRPPNRLNAST